MKHYQKVKPTERLILKALVAKDDNPEITEAFSRALDFFDSYDKVEHTAHAEVMRKIYLNNMPPKMVALIKDRLLGHVQN